jgi:hypothetical protein
MPSNRLLLCRPRGGLNDNLCQIELCWRYAEAHNRTLIIDGKRSNLFPEFSDFFELFNPRIGVHINSASAEDLEDAADCFPSELAGSINRYRSVYSPDHGHNFVEEVSKTRLSFDFSQDHAARILIHEQCGGGTESFDCLNRLTLSAKMKAIMVDTLEKIGAGYIGIHVRNTDYRTDFRPFFSNIHTETIGKRLLVCSDDRGVIEEARAFFSEAETFVVSDIPNTNQHPLHERQNLSDEERHANAVSSIVDLLALGASDKLYFSDITRGYPSGYSRLAKYLNDHKAVIRRLVHGP